MQAAKALFEKIEDIRKTYALFTEHSSVLVALSGGADSVALLLALRRRYPSLILAACHVNHHLRGEESERDAAFVTALCKKEHILLDILDADVEGFAAEKGISTELAARRIRYEFFQRVCRNRGIRLVATAHTASDNAETVLFNLARGTGLAGLCGIPPKRTLCEDVQLVRPLLFASRDEIEAFLAEYGEHFVTDSSNLSDDYSRNFVRHHIVPHMKSLNPSFEKSIKKSTAALREIQIFIEKTVNTNLTDDVYRLSSLDDCILKQVILRLYKNTGADKELESVHIEKIASLIRVHACDSEKTSEICLPGKISAHISGGKLYFAPTVRKDRNVPVLENAFCPVTLTWGLNEIADTPFAVYLSHLTSDELFSGKEQQALDKWSAEYRLYDMAILDGNAVSGSLVVRGRASGDTVRHGGMTKKLKELFSKKKIPAEHRAILPIVCDGYDILFVPRTVLCDTHKRAVNASNARLRIAVYSKTPL